MSHLMSDIIASRPCVPCVLEFNIQPKLSINMVWGAVVWRTYDLWKVRTVCASKIKVMGPQN